MDFAFIGYISHLNIDLFQFLVWKIYYNLMIFNDFKIIFNHNCVILIYLNNEHFLLQVKQLAVVHSTLKKKSLFFRFIYYWARLGTLSSVAIILCLLKWIWIPLTTGNKTIDNIVNIPLTYIIIPLTYIIIP